MKRQTTDRKDIAIKNYYDESYTLVQVYALIPRHALGGTLDKLKQQADLKKLDYWNETDPKIKQRKSVEMVRDMIYAVLDTYKDDLADWHISTDDVDIKHGKAE